MMRKFKFTSFFILFLFFFFSCSKQLEIKPNLPARKPDYLARGGRQNTSYIAWENADFFITKMILAQLEQLGLLGHQGEVLCFRFMKLLTGFSKMDGFCYIVL
ncbi:hypothetical protein BWI96_17225 [Siphonobacter sp. SORGH_AS_0500]|nr:hypothetical protein BWI96_17225 [Siphonobacter sp. SORGH_AS_0500]